MKAIEQIEVERLELQARLDGEKTPEARNQLGQFATPTALATDILSYARRIIPEESDVRFLDPAIGTGSFYSAFSSVFATKSLSPAVGFEIDDHYGEPARKLWTEHALDIRAEDFTQASPPDCDTEKATLIISNPPYVRHHHLSKEDKVRLKDMVSAHYEVSLSGLSGLYCYFLCLSKEWMAQSGLAAWLIPSEFMDVNYGRAVKEFLLNHVTLLHIHRFSPDDAQFGDALVSSAVVWFKNENPPSEHRVKFSYGGSLLDPMKENYYSSISLRDENKWTALPRCESSYRSVNGNTGSAFRDYFDVKRGIATGANNFFILSPQEVERRKIPEKFLVPILPSPRYLTSDIIESDENGIPILDKVGFLFTSDLPEEIIREKYPDVWNYLEAGKSEGVSDGYICRTRQPWYSQEYRDSAPFLCTYMGRVNSDGDSNPFRFILNRSEAIVANVYLMLYPKQWMRKSLEENPELAKDVWDILQSIPAEVLIGEGRVYGGGLHKLEPKELLNTPVDDLAALFDGVVKPPTSQLSLF